MCFVLILHLEVHLENRNKRGREKEREKKKNNKDEDEENETDKRNARDSRTHMVCNRCTRMQTSQYMSIYGRCVLHLNEYIHILYT